ncbi:MAG: hypothetical protein PVSMB8_08030 [Vulcanimicrobiaceae bacterium]
MKLRFQISKARIAGRLLVGVAAAALLSLSGRPSAADQGCTAAHVGFAPIELLASVACAGPKEAAPTGLHDGQPFNMSGTVESIDYGSNVIRVRSRGEVVPVSLTPTTAINLRGLSGSIADLRKGGHITVVGNVQDGAFVALSVTISK